jgi:hypothetical protein
MYGYCTHTSVHVHNYTSFPIITDQPCDAGESLLRAGAAPSELPPSWHQSFQLTDHPGAACHAQIATGENNLHLLDRDCLHPYRPEKQGCPAVLHLRLSVDHENLLRQLFIPCIYIVHTWYIYGSYIESIHHSAAFNTVQPLTDAFKRILEEESQES